MVSQIFSGAVVGLDALPIVVEADVSNGLPNTVIVGLPDVSVQESKERVKAALKNSGCKYPQTRVSVNLAPADTPKAGTHYDLPIAISIVKASGQISMDTQGKWFVGELSLDGGLRAVPGALAIAIAAVKAGILELFLPESNLQEASLVDGIKLFGCKNLKDVINHLGGFKPANPYKLSSKVEQVNIGISGVDIGDISGQESAKRALEVASAGGHNILMYGPPGSGKTLLARSISGILPNLTSEEALELTKIYSIAGKLDKGQAVSHRPVRTPHHTASSVALVGGGSLVRPGEVTLAHRGVLYLDEFPEFSRNVLEALRQPLEDGVITVSRARNTFTYPAKFMLVASLNPCPCGYYGDGTMRCVCSPIELNKYQRKLSGPLMDRIDLHIKVPRVDYNEVVKGGTGDPSSVVRKRVENAREKQYARLGSGRTNADMNLVEVRKFCELNSEVGSLLSSASEKYNLSARSVHRILKVARTMADLSGEEKITLDNLAEALIFRGQ